MADAVAVVTAALRGALAGDAAALAALASKVLGYAVVAGAAVLKLPQVRLCVHARVHSLPRASSLGAQRKKCTDAASRRARRAPHRSSRSCARATRTASAPRRTRRR